MRYVKTALTPGYARMISSRQVAAGSPSYAASTSAPMSAMTSGRRSKKTVTTSRASTAGLRHLRAPGLAARCRQRTAHLGLETL